MNRGIILPATVLASILILGAAAAIRAKGVTRDEVGIDEKLGAEVALDAVLRDEGGKDITLRQLIDKPTVLTLNYFTCTGICTPLLNGLVDTLNKIGLEPGKEFQVVTMSFDPSDTPEVAHQKRINYLKQMKRPFPPMGWRFLTGSDQATKAVTDSVGFNFRRTESGFAHAGAILVLTPKGFVSRYMYGISFLPADLQMAIQEAAGGEVRPSISKVLAFCYSYDPQGKRYVFDITRAAGAVTLLAAAVFMIYLFVAGRSRRSKEKVGF